MHRNQYSTDAISAIDAKFEAQKIAFSPLTFQAARSLRDFGILRSVSDSGDNGLSRKEIARSAGISEYGAAVLAEIGLGMGALRLRPPAEMSGAGNSAAEEEERYVLGKIGWFLLEDAMTGVNFNFVNDVCYKGAFNLPESIRGGKPCGLSVFGDQWHTIYEALSSLPENVKKSWFDFDHFYSDIAFPEALPLVFAKPPRRLFDIGGNTAKWALACCKYNADVRVTIIDLPGQTAVAQENVSAAGLEGRINAQSCDVLDSQTEFPAGADTDVWVLEPLWDMQRFPASAFSLQATSLYFTCMANGSSKMYRFGELCAAVEGGGFELKAAHHNLGTNSYSLLRFRKKS